MKSPTQGKASELEKAMAADQLAKGLQKRPTAAELQEIENAKTEAAYCDLLAQYKQQAQEQYEGGMAEVMTLNTQVQNIAEAINKRLYKNLNLADWSITSQLDNEPFYADC